MTEISDKDTIQIDGGLSIWGILGIGAAIVFLIGVFDGYTRPLSCNE